MTQDEIIEMARQAGFPIFGTKVVANNPADQIMADSVTAHYHESAIQFAKLVAAKEREACVKVCEELRRLHEVNQELLMALKMGVDETLDYIRLNHLTGAENNQWIVLAQAAIAKGEKT